MNANMFNEIRGFSMPNLSYKIKKITVMINKLLDGCQYNS